MKFEPGKGPRISGGSGAEEQYTAGVPLARIVPRTIARSLDLVVLSQPRSLSTERFRRLRSLLAGALKQKSRVVVVTSAAPAEGKSLIAANLALAIASGKDEKVLVLDADLRRPRIEGWLTPRPSLGLSDILGGKTTKEHVILDLKDCALNILPAGQIPQDPVELLSSERMRTLLAELREQYQWIIVDTPPIVPFTDADAVGRLSDGYVLVVRAGRTPVSVFQQAAALATGAPILGIVLNDAKQSLADSTSKYDRYYTHYYSKDPEK